MSTISLNEMTHALDMHKEPRHVLLHNLSFALLRRHQILLEVLDPIKAFRSVSLVPTGEKHSLHPLANYYTLP